MRSLITGGRGFVGTWLADHLRSLGDEVVAIDAEVDVTDPAALLSAVSGARPEAIYHLAALTHVGDSWDEPLRVLEVNVIGTGALLAAARECGTDPRILVTSSAEVYGAVTDPALLPLDEELPHRPPDAVCGQQAGRRGPRGPGLPRARPACHHRPAVQPHRTGPDPPVRRAGTGQAHRGGRPTRGSRRSRSATCRRGGTSPTCVTSCGPTGSSSSRAGPGAVYNVCSGRDVAIGAIADSLLELAGTTLELRGRPVAGPAGGGPRAAGRSRPA